MNGPSTGVVYIITNIVTNQEYEGQTIDPAARWKAHRVCGTKGVVRPAPA